MSFFNSQQQAALMAQMFQNPQGGGGMPPMPGMGGIGSGATNLAPSFDGPAGAPGVQTLPWNGQRPDFGPQPFDPRQGSGIVPLGMPPQNFSPRIDPTIQQQQPQQPPNGFDPGPLPSERRGLQDAEFYPGGTASPEEEEEKRRRVLIEAIIKKAFGGN